MNRAWKQINKWSRSSNTPYQQIIKRYHKIELVHNDKCKISHTKPIKIKQYQSCNSLELFLKEMLWILDHHQNPIYFAWINPTNSIILELWELSSCLLKIKEIILKSKKICELKIFEKLSGIKTIWKKNGVLKFIW